MRQLLPIDHLQVDFEDADGVTSLLAASVTGHVETIAALVARGANLDYETRFVVLLGLLYMKCYQLTTLQQSQSKVQTLELERAVKTNDHASEYLQ